MTDEIKFILNDELVSVKINPATVLLDFIRKQKNLTGTKEGCKEGDCGACTVLLGSLSGNGIKYKSINSCLFPLGNIKNKHVVTIEGLNSDALTPIQTEFIKEGASQCGFCTPGFIVSLTGYLITTEKIDTENAINSIAGNICRCTGYTSIKRSVDKIIENIKDPELKINNRITYLINKNILPNYFSNIYTRLKNLSTDKTDGQLNGIKKIIGGGTDLYVQQPDELIEKDVTFLADKDLSFIDLKDEKCIIGASTTFEMIKNSEVFQSNFMRLEKFMNLMASLPIRNSASIGGNIINASPIGDMTIFLLALNASVLLVKGNHRRKIFLKELFNGYKKLNKTADEYLESVEFNLPKRNFKFNFEKVSKRTNLDIASVNSAVSFIFEGNIILEAHISAGGVAPIPLYLEKTSKHLNNKKIEIHTIKEVISIAQTEISPISDIRGSAEYKRLLIEQLIKAHFIELFPKLINVEVLI